MPNKKKTSDLEELGIAEMAKKRVNSRFGLLSHFVVFIVANTLFFGIDFAVTKDADWAFIPLFGWGIGLFIHALFVVFGEFIENWKEGAVKSEIEKLKDKKK